MEHSINFMKMGCTSKISQISEFQNHLPKKSDFHISELIKKKQFAMTDPVDLEQMKKKCVDNNVARKQLIIVSGVALSPE